MSRRRRLLAFVLVAVLLVSGALVYLDEVTSYRFHSEPFSFASGGNTLTGTLALPAGDGPFALAVFLHGDGPVTADHNGGYPPIWEALADSGVASVSWDKPGTGQSTGNWEQQSMQDRADEAMAAIGSLQDHAKLDTTRVGALAASQGGWPLPLLAQQRPLSFAVALSPAIDWRRQGRYDLNAELTTAGVSQDTRTRAHTFSDRLRSLIDQGASYEQYRAVVRTDRPAELEPFFGLMSADRWRFVELNEASDATDALPALADTPVLLLLAGHDAHVDVRETEQVYRQVLGPDCLKVVRHQDANHSMIKNGLGESGPRLYLHALLQPRGIFADGVLQDIRAFTSDVQNSDIQNPPTPGALAACSGPAPG